MDDVYVLNRPENIVKDEGGVYHLSDYAKAHLRDNCLLFRTNRSKEILDTVIPDCLNAEWLSSEEEIICLTMSCLSEEIIVYKEEQRLLKNLESCNSFKEFVTKRRKELNLSVEQISNYLCLGQRGAEGLIYGNGYEKITLQTITFLCIILQLTPKVSQKLFDKSIIDWPVKNTKEQTACQFILNTMWMKPIEEVRSFYNEMTK